MDDELWNALDEALSRKRSRAVTLSELNRLVRKRFAHLPINYLTQENCVLRREWLTARHLQTFNPGHCRTEPHQMDGPIVAWEHQGKCYMIDGTNRLNVWLRDGDATPHETIIITRQESQ